MSQIFHEDVGPGALLVQLFGQPFFDSLHRIVFEFTLDCPMLLFQLTVSLPLLRELFQTLA